MNETSSEMSAASHALTAIADGKERALAHLAAANGSTDREGSPSRKRKRDDATKLELSQYLGREYAWKADAAQRDANPVLLLEKQAELQDYKTLAPLRLKDPGAIFGVGYEGYGNPRTDDRSAREPFVVYPRMRRPGKKQNRLPKCSRKDILIQAEQDEDLVPIRLDIEWGKIKLRDTFTWNINDRTASVDYFAQQLVEDFGLEPKACEPLIRRVALDIKEQLQDYTPHIFSQSEPVDPHTPYYAYKNDELRILIKLNITIGQNTLIDQFEWEVNSPYNSAEDFARQMTNDLSLAGEFTTAIAHCIREQCQLYTRSLHLTGYAWDGRLVDDPDLKENFLPSPLPVLFRPYQMAKEYSPYIYELNEADLERTELSISREQRRQKRSTNRRGGPVLPDLKDKPKTIRSLVVSSVIPGGALTMEDSRIFRRARTRTKAGKALRDEFEDSGSDPESEDSGPDSPVPAHLLAPGTARQRTMRGAALTASAGIRGVLSGAGRSMTPEVSHTAEPRSAARRRDYKENSSDDDDDNRLVVTLKISRAKYREWAKQNRIKEKLGDTRAANSPTPNKPGTLKLTLNMPAPLNLAGAPPPSPNATSGYAAGGKPAENMFGAIDAPPIPESPLPDPPAWLTSSLAALRSQKEYRRDRFTPIMKHTAVDPRRGPIPADETTRHLEHKYVPRIRCLDCPGKLYVTGPGMTAERFEAHLKNRKHREAVQERIDSNAK